MCFFLGAFATLELIMIEDSFYVTTYVFCNLTFVNKFHVMKWAEPRNGLMVFNVGSLIRVGSYVVFCISFVLEPYVYG